jgi:DNA-directed RNA polymerase subunit RPC12/RpoP
MSDKICPRCGARMEQVENQYYECVFCEYRIYIEVEDEEATNDR